MKFDLVSQAKRVRFELNTARQLQSPHFLKKIRLDSCQRTAQKTSCLRQPQSSFIICSQCSIATHQSIPGHQSDIELESCLQVMASPSTTKVLFWGMNAKAADSFTGLLWKHRNSSTRSFCETAVAGGESWTCVSLRPILQQKGASATSTTIFSCLTAEKIPKRTECHSPVVFLSDTRHRPKREVIHSFLANAGATTVFTFIWVRRRGSLTSFWTVGHRLQVLRTFLRKVGRR